METIDSGGEWWLPDNPERRISGWLTFDSQNGVVLRLVGAFRDFFSDGERRSDGSVLTTEAALEHSGSYPRILGLVGSKAITLESCFRTTANSHIFGGGLASETIHADRMYRGAWYEPDEGACGDRITVALTHLVYWLRPASLHESWIIDSPPERLAEEPRIEIAARDVPSVVIERPDGTLSLIQRLGLSGDRISGRSITQDFDVRFEPSGVRPWHALVEEVGIFQDVLTLAIGRVPNIEHLTLNHPDLDQTLPDGHVYRNGVDVFARWTDQEARTLAKELHDHDVLFHFDVVGTDGLQRLLMTADRFRRQLRRVTATLRTTEMYASDRLLNRCAAIESLDRVRTGTRQSNFKARLRRCATIAGDPFLEIVPDVETWLEVLRTRRDHVAHHLFNDDRETGFLDLILADSAYFLFALCFLREAEVPAPVFDLFRENRRVRWLARRIPEALATSS